MSGACQKYIHANSTTRVLLLTGDTSLDIRIEGYDATLGSLLMRVADHSSIQTDTVPVKPGNNAYSHVWLLRSEAWELITPCGEKIHLTEREYPFLQVLAEANNTQVSRTTLLKKLG